MKNQAFVHCQINYTSLVAISVLLLKPMLLSVGGVCLFFIKSRRIPKDTLPSQPLPKPFVSFHLNLVKIAGLWSLYQPLPWMFSSIDGPIEYPEVSEAGVYTVSQMGGSVSGESIQTNLEPIRLRLAWSVVAGTGT